MTLKAKTLKQLECILQYPPAITTCYVGSRYCFDDITTINGLDWETEKIIDFLISYYIYFCLDDKWEKEINSILGLKGKYHMDYPPKGKWLNIYMKRKVDNLNDKINEYSKKQLAKFRNDVQDKIMMNIMYLCSYIGTCFESFDDTEDSLSCTENLIQIIYDYLQPMRSFLLGISDSRSDTSIKRFSENRIFDTHLLRIIGSFLIR